MVGRPEAETGATDAATATTADRRDASGGRGGGGTNMSACEHFGWFTRVFTRGLVFEPGNWDTVSSIARRARENRTRIRFLTSGSPWQHPPRPSSLPWTSTTSTPSTTTATASSSGTNGFRSFRLSNSLQQAHGTKSPIIQANGPLTSENVFDYFASSMFYDKQSNNQVLRMQTMHTGQPIANEAEELK